jgi:hypothetical protein
VTLLSLILKVEQVGGPSSFEELIGPLLVAIAAIVAAGLAAWVARRNHSSQLAHDRQLRDMDYARRSIGLAVNNIAVAVDTATSYGTAAWFPSEASERSERATAAIDSLPYMDYDEMGDRIDLRPDEQIRAMSEMREDEEVARTEEETEAIKAEVTAAQNAMDKRSQLSTEITRLAADGWKLQIYIGVETQVVSRHQAVTHALSDWYDIHGVKKETGWKLVEKPSIEPVAEAMAEFVKACQEWSAKRVDDGP